MPAHARRARLRRAGRISAVTGGAFAALLTTAMGWPGAPPASEMPGGQAGPAPSPAASPWLLSRTAPAAMPLNPAMAAAAQPTVAKLTHLRPVDVAVVSATTLSAKTLDAIRKLPGVVAVEAADAARIQVNGKFVAVLGVDPSRFRAFAAKPTAKDTAFWRSVAAGNLGISYTMGKHDKLPTGTSVSVTGRSVQTLAIGKLGTVGIGGVDAVVSDAVARSLGFPTQNAIMISAPKANFARLAKKLKKVVPHSAAVAQIATQTGSAGSGSAPPLSNPVPGQTDTITGMVTLTEVRSMLTAALSRVGMPYVWGAAGPTSFDCSGLVQWSFRRAGIIMPRVAADQARTGPAVPVSRLQPGDLLFYHTDPTAPGYISHVAIYLGDGKMIQAPQPGQNVEIVPVDLGSEFAGAVEVSPRVAAQAAATSV